MKVIIPMAGFGSRLRPHTFTKPKPLINVAGKPVLGHVLDMFVDLPVEEYLMITGYLGDQIEDYMARDYSHLKASFFEQKELNGQSPAVLLAKDHVDGPVLIVFVDTIIEADLSKLKHETADAVAWVKAVEDPRRFGVAEVDENDFVTRLIEKPSSMDNNLVVVGFYYFKDGPACMRALERQVNEGIQTKGEFYLADAFQLMLQEGLKMRVERVDVWEDCGKPETVLHTNQFLLDNGRDNSAEVQSRKDVVIIPPVNIHPTARVEQSVIGPYVTLAAGCTVKNAIVRDSIIDEEAYIGETMLANSLIGKQARVTGRFRSFNVGDMSGVGFE